MKILLISNMYPSHGHPYYGIFVKNFENGIIGKGGTVYKAVIEGRGKNKLEKIMKYLKFFYDVVKLVFTKEYDLIYVHYIGHSLLPLVPIRVLLKKPLIINAHGSDVFSASKLGKFIQKLVAPIIQKADLIVVPSNYFAAMVMEKFLIRKDKIFVSPSGGIDTSLFKPLKNLKVNTTFTIGYVSRIDEGKGWDILLMAAKELKNKISIPFTVNIIGGGSQESNLKSMITQLGLENEVKYLGPIPHHQLPTHYNHFDLFAFTTRLAESLGLVGLEAMACGVPVVGSDIGGVKGYVENKYNGELFEPGNTYELTQCLKKFIIMDKKNLEFYSTNALRTAKQYDSKTVSNNLSKKLKEIIYKDDNGAK